MPRIRTANQIRNDCKRCETSKSKTCKCKVCNGAAHGLERAVNHPLEVILTPEEYENISGYNL